MNYEDMTDFDLDCKVAEIAFNGCTPYKDSSSGLCMVNLNKTMEDDIYFHPCSNPSDAWPIILKNKISINAKSKCDYETGMHQFTGKWRVDAFISCDGEFSIGDGVSECINENPLRAAMIVYLMMNESRN